MWLMWMMACDFSAGEPPPTLSIVSLTPRSEQNLNELSPQSQAILCIEYAIQNPVAVDCAVVDVAVNPLGPVACAQHWIPDGCTATVGEWRACQEAIAADPCALIERHSACRPIEDCGVHLWSAGLGLDPEVRLDDLAGDEAQKICEAGNQFDEIPVSCIDFIDPVPFEPDVSGCLSQIDEGICGTIEDYLECQLDLLADVESTVCRLEVPPACGALVCF